MAYTYEWKIKGLKKAVNANDLSDVIIGTQWQVTGISEDGHSGSFNGATPFKPAEVDPTNFTAFEDLTEEQVLGWIKSVVSGSNRTTNYWDHISGQIHKEATRNSQVHVELQPGDLPWATPSVDNPVTPSVAGY
jgi:hypothetical protein